MASQSSLTLTSRRLCFPALSELPLETDNLLQVEKWLLRGVNPHQTPRMLSSAKRSMSGGGVTGSGAPQLSSAAQRSAVRCRALPCGARPCLAVLRAYQISYESSRYQRLCTYVEHRISKKDTPAQLSLASPTAQRSAVRYRAASCPAMRCGAVRCCAVLCRALLCFVFPTYQNNASKQTSRSRAFYTPVLFSPLFPYNIYEVYIYIYVYIVQHGQRLPCYSIGVPWYNVFKVRRR